MTSCRSWLLGAVGISIAAQILLNVVVDVLSRDGSRQQDARDHEIHQFSQFAAQGAIVAGGVAAMLLALAELAVARADRLEPKPANLTFEQAAAVPASATTALQALRRGDVAAGQRVLITGAGGGIGTFAVQLAKGLGAHVTGVCGTGKVDLVRSPGADDVSTTRGRRSRSGTTSSSTPRAAAR